ncbi:MAG: TonB-dependent receptor [Pseudomonadota bacterium]|nr:TonB-dependent receptor [Pseudomonadota bacterium]
MSNRTVTARALLLAGAALLFAQPAWAQDAEQVAAEPNEQAEEAGAEPAETGEIVVTARRRAEALQDVPIAVTAYSGEQLEREGAIDITDVGDTTPNVTLETSRGTNTTLTAFIRGVGQQDPVAGFEQGVGMYLDDVYLNRPQGAVLDIYDVERIEILRGPQGTLYGRNTIGGAVKYVTRRLPDDPEVKIRANLGTYGQKDLVISAGGGLTEGFRVGASVARLSRKGFGENLTTGEENYNKDIWAVRGTVEMEPTDAISLKLSGDYTWDDSNARGGHRLIPSQCNALCGHAIYPVLDDEFDTRGALADPKQKVRSGGVAAHLSVEVADGFTLKSISAYRASKSNTPIDFDALPEIDVDVPAKYKDHQASQELQLEIDRGPLAGVIGAYYLDANASNIFDVRLYTTCPTVPRPGCVIALPGLSAVTQGDVDTKTWAIFGDFTYDISDQWSVSVGGRYTSDKRHARIFRANYILGGQPGLGGDAGFGNGVQLGAPTSNFDGKRKDTAFTPRASVSFRPNDNHNIYLSYSRGFKGGGFDPRGLTTATPRSNPAVPPTAEDIYDFMAFDPETVDSYELGWKGSLFDKRLRMAVALFRANYKDVQVPGSAGGVTAGGVPTFVGITTNAGKARFQGVEVEANWAIAEDLAAEGDKLNFAGSIGYLDAEYREFLTVVNRNEAGAPVPAHEEDMADHREVQNTPKWTMSGSVNYDTPLHTGRLNLNSTLSYRSKSQQFELAAPGIDQKGFALLDASIVWRSAGDRFSIGLHGKNLTDTRYKTAGYVFLLQNPYTGEYINGAGAPALTPSLGREGVLTAFYGNPRQVFLSLGAKF